MFDLPPGIKTVTGNDIQPIDATLDPMLAETWSVAGSLRPDGVRDRLRYLLRSGAAMARTVGIAIIDLEGMVVVRDRKDCEG